MDGVLRRSIENWPDELKEAWIILKDGMTKYIPTIDNRFRQFTRHDVSHLFALENILDWLVPSAVWKELNHYELFCLMGSIWAHDIGMGANNDEIEQFCKNIHTEPPNDDNLLWFLRENHPKISRDIISSLFRSQSNASLTGLGKIIADISESHGNYNLEELQLRIPVGHSGSTVRPVYLAILLRLADILHCTADRAPMNLFKARAIDDPISVRHWKRHQSTVGIGPDLANGVILVHIIADDVITFDWAMEYCNYIQKEIDYCSNVISRLNLHADKLTLPFHKIKKICDTPFLPRIIRIKVDASAAIALLAGKYVYDDDSVVIRELLQNAIDAINLRQSRDSTILPEVILEYNSVEKWISVSDNGIGMTLDEIEGALLSSCTSGFRRVKNPEDMLARYGIGFLTTLSIGTTVLVSTRQMSSSPNQGYQTKITGSNDPVEIRQVRIDNPGTRVCVYLPKSASISKEEVLKWTPERDQIPWITIRYDGQQIKPREPSLGVAEEPLKFINKNYTRHHSGTRVVFRSALLVTNSKKNPWPCGLSFQSSSSHVKEVHEVPDVKGRLFVGGIPIVGKDGERPRYQATSNERPAYEKLFGPFDLYLDKPGLIALNIARNGLIVTQRNEKLLQHAGELVCYTILDFFKDYSTHDNKAFLASRVVSEFWLWSLAGYLGNFLFRRHPSDDLGCIEILSEIWDEIICYWYIGSNTSHRPIGELRKLNQRIVFIWHPVFDYLINQRESFQTLLNKLVGELGEVIIVTDCGADSRRRFSPVEVFFSISRSVAMFDPLCANIDLPPLLVFSLCEDTDFLPAGKLAVQLYGSKKLFFGYLQRSFGIGMHTGTNAPRLMINLCAEREELDRLSEFLVANDRFFQLPYYSKRESLHDWFVRMGVPAELVTTDKIHQSLIKRYPLVEAV
jgi:hypothetical protein